MARQPLFPSTCPVGYRQYTVISGDTFYLIARRYNTSMDSLIAANPHITNPAQIMPGDVLCVPGRAEEDMGQTKSELAENGQEMEREGTREDSLVEDEMTETRGTINLATTTSTVDTGLLEVLIPKFEREYGYNVRVYSVGSGRAISLGQRGQVDVLLTHTPEEERPLVRSGEFINYRPVMHNDFVIVGPPSDPAAIRGQTSAAQAFRKISERRATFISRGDNSGTNQKEMEIWSKAGIEPQGTWYRRSNAGMADTLQIASEQNGYTLSDRGTYLAERNNLNLELLVEGDPILQNYYHVMQVNPAKNPQVNAEGAESFVEFMVSEQVQNIILTYGEERFGQPLFVPDALND
ncbi:PBP superfamily domain protein [Sporotomaculum syntrophicum]|uniref:PBP superfamily domain protein n=1 Tax=Sporotomaculum syntrophicum TaxID=182264 RepID=A0A9D2WR10_9FIRM|nr:substrate-binding domain-containing protein [Sporotomaculum syntrophicum]KAF1085336.1 PBP superfamily domain protein [Sporotomaculum syntrophicum]